ncbi:MAG TPA: hypothetical protein VGM83_01820 [Devosiaceae bacterium]
MSTDARDTLVLLLVGLVAAALVLSAGTSLGDVFARLSHFGGMR